MNNIKLTADSTCDLSLALREALAVELIPLSVTLGDRTGLDGVDISPSDIFAYVDAGGSTPQTAAVNLAQYHEVFSRLSAQHDAVIHISLSSALSASFQNASLIASEFPNVFVIDSQNLSTGSGLLLLEADELRRAGKTGSEIADALRELVPKIEASFVIDTLEYLHRGGRCSTLAAIGANLLRLKPCIEVADGGMRVGKKYRGSIGLCIQNYVRDRFEGRDDIRRDKIFITHCACDDALVREVSDQVRAYGFENIHVTSAGCTISSHCGPGTLGVLFIRK